MGKDEKKVEVKDDVAAEYDPDEFALRVQLATRDLPEKQIKVLSELFTDRLNKFLTAAQAEWVKLERRIEALEKKSGMVK